MNGRDMSAGLGAVAITAGVAPAGEKINEAAHAGQAEMGSRKTLALIDAGDSSLASCAKRLAKRKKLAV